MSDLQVFRQAIDAVNFDVPVGVRRNDLLWDKFGVLCQSVRQYERFFVTVYSVDVPPSTWGSSDAFPTDLLVLHHSPRNLNSRKSTRNWRFWETGEHKYSENDSGWRRRWLPPGHFSECLHFSYMHIDVPLPGVQRGDVLAFTGSAITFADLLPDGSILGEGHRPGVFGTEKCPFFIVDTVDVYKNWSDDPSTPIDEHIKLVAQSVTTAEAIKIQTDQPLALPPALGEYDIRAW